MLGRNISNTLTSTFKENDNDTNNPDSIRYEHEEQELAHNPNNNNNLNNLQFPTPLSNSKLIIENPLPTQIQQGKFTPQLIMATATLTKAVKALLTDVNGAFNIEFNGMYICIFVCYISLNIYNMLMAKYCVILYVIYILFANMLYIFCLQICYIYSVC